MSEYELEKVVKTGYFDHEKWDVYQAALDFVILASEIVEQLPRGKAYIADQLQRAGTSIPLNIAEGAGEHSLSEKARFYRMAKRSATECASILDVCKRLKLLDENEYSRGVIAENCSNADKNGTKQVAFIISA